MQPLAEILENAGLLKDVQDLVLPPGPKSERSEPYEAQISFVKRPKFEHRDFVNFQEGDRTLLGRVLTVDWLTSAESWIYALEVVDPETAESLGRRLGIMESALSYPVKPPSKFVFAERGRLSRLLAEGAFLYDPALPGMPFTAPLYKFAAKRWTAALPGTDSPENYHDTPLLEGRGHPH